MIVFELQSAISLLHQVQEATTAVAKLHGVKLKPHGKKPAGTMLAEAPVQLWARQVSGEGAHVRKWRVIVRNLPFKVCAAVQGCTLGNHSKADTAAVVMQVTESHLRSAFAPAGFAWEVTLPRNPDGQVKGFAFVAFTLRAHAEKAIKLVNGMVHDVLRLGVAPCCHA